MTLHYMDIVFQLIAFLFAISVHESSHAWMANLRGDPTAVFVILGFADPKGDPKKNITISQTRAESVLKAMRDKCDVKNIMHPVPMGGSKLLDAQNLEKNRIVEIWVVLP